MTDQTVRPVRTADEIRRCGHTDQQHRDHAGQAADDRSQDRAIREALAERDQARAELAAARATVHRDIARHLGWLATDTALLRDWLTTCDPMPTSYAELLGHLAHKIGRGDDAPSPGSAPTGAQGIRPADWERKAVDAVTDAWTYVEDDAAVTAHRLAEIAVRAVIDAGLAGPGGRCRQCGATYPRTLPADQDPLCWTCASEEVVGLPEYADAPERDATLAQIDHDAAQLQAAIRDGQIADRLGEPTPTTTREG